MKHRLSITALLIISLSVPAKPEDQRKPKNESAKASFAKLQKVIVRLRKETSPDKSALKELYTREAQRLRQEPDKLLAELERAKVKKVQQKGERALVSFETPDDPKRATRAVLMQRVNGKWRLDCASSYVLASKELDQSRGKKPAKVRLSMRTTNGSYGSSAYSFVYASGNMRKYKNRVDIWYCHNQDFHVPGKIVDIGKSSLAKVKTIPLEAAWKQTVRAKKGHTYVLRCGPSDRRDFFVAFTVRALKRDVVEIEWTLLAGGLNAPLSIHDAVPLPERNQREGADGMAGLCGRNG